MLPSSQQHPLFVRGTDYKATAVQLSVCLCLFEVSAQDTLFWFPYDKDDHTGFCSLETV